MSKQETNKNTERPSAEDLRKISDGYRDIGFRMFDGWEGQKASIEKYLLEEGCLRKHV